MLENLTPAHSMYRIVSSVAERILSRREDIRTGLMNRDPPCVKFEPTVLHEGDFRPTWITRVLSLFG